MPSAIPPDAIDRLFNQASSLSKTPSDQLKLLSALLSALLLCLPFAYFPPTSSSSSTNPPKSKRSSLSTFGILPSPFTLSSLIPHIYGFAVSTFYLTALLKLYDGYTQLLIEVLGTWIVCGISLNMADSKGRIFGTKWPWMVFWAVMGHLTYNHVYRIIAQIPNTSLDHTPTQMVLTMKLSSFAWNLFDGQNYAGSQLDSYQTAHAVSALPSFLEFLGFAFFPAGTLIGPNFTFASYSNFVQKTVFMAGQGKDEGKGGRKVIIPDGRFSTGLNRLVFGLVNMGLFAVMGGKFAYKKMLVQSFQDQPFLYKFAFAQIAGLSARVKFYGAWKLAEAGFVLSGMGWDPATQSWTASRNIQVRPVELAQNFKGYLDAWNANTNVWLREAVYKRVTQPGKRPGFASKMATFGTSALWHGPQPAYFFTFLLGGFFSNLAVHIRKNIRPFFLPPGTLAPPSSRSGNANGQANGASNGSANGHSHSANGTIDVSKPSLPIPTPPPSTKYIIRKRVYDLICIFNTQTSINFAVVPFILVDTRATIAVWRTLSWYGLWMAILPIAFFQIGGAGWLRGMLKRREKRHFAKLEARKGKGLSVDHVKEQQIAKVEEEKGTVLGREAANEVKVYERKVVAEAEKDMNVAKAL